MVYGLPLALAAWISRRMSMERRGVRMRVRASSTALRTALVMRVKLSSFWPTRLVATDSHSLECNVTNCNCNVAYYVTLHCNVMSCIVCTDTVGGATLQPAVSADESVRRQVNLRQANCAGSPPLTVTKGHMGCVCKPAALSRPSTCTSDAARLILAPSCQQCGEYAF